MDDVFNQVGEASFSGLEITHCGQPMRPMGLWPNQDYTKATSKYHCTKCNAFVSVEEPSVKLVKETK